MDRIRHAARAAEAYHSPGGGGLSMRRGFFSGRTSDAHLLCPSDERRMTGIAVNLSVSLTAASSLYTREPRGAGRTHGARPASDEIWLFSCRRQEKSRQLSLPASPPMPCEPSYNLHKKAGGSPLCCFSASNVQPASFSRPGGLQSAAEVLASLIRDVGLNEL